MRHIVHLSHGPDPHLLVLSGKRSRLVVSFVLLFNCILGFESHSRKGALPKCA